MTGSDSERHIRRPHYSGKYPKKFDEKYKEKQPEKYADLIDHVRQKGNTPAGMHIPICVEEILGFFELREGMTGLDCTLGYGGHTQKLLEKLNHRGMLHALDVDRAEAKKTEMRLKALGYSQQDLMIHPVNFARIREVAEAYGPFDFILADLGVSSMQLDDPERGFSTREDGPLDLRLDQSSGKTASERLSEMSAAEIEGMLIENADEPYAGRIAKSLYSAGRKGGIKTTGQLKEIIEKALKEGNTKIDSEEVRKSVRRVFQAIRIDVNSEYEVLEQLLEGIPYALKPGGKVAILTFHSGEDRIVKQIMKRQQKDGEYVEISRDVIRPSAKECYDNPRAHSAKLRTAVKYS